MYCRRVCACTSQLLCSIFCVLLTSSSLLRAAFSPPLGAPTLLNDEINLVNEHHSQEEEDDLKGEEEHDPGGRHASPPHWDFTVTNCNLLLYEATLH